MSTEELLQLLRTNNYFPDPERWVDFARTHSFRGVKSTRRMRCPSCDSDELTAVGQYVYYSSLIRLQRCRGCDLIFSDVLLAPEVIAGHFESAYKDESYFLHRRQIIFAEIADRVATLLPKGGSLIDVGGAKGHLAEAIRHRRPDVRIVVNDISQASCEYAERALGFETICGDITALSGRSERFDVVLGIDVAYYEPRLTTTWETLAALTAPHGHVILRIPNRLRWIRFAESLSACGRRFGIIHRAQSHVASFNSEHIYIFSRSYLRRALRQHGFTEISHLPSAFLRSIGVRQVLLAAAYRLVKGLAAATKGQILLSSSQLVIAKRAAD